MKKNAQILQIRRDALWYIPVLFGLCIFTVADKIGWPLALFVHFSIHIAIAGLFYAIIAVFNRRMMVAAIAAVVSLAIGSDQLRNLMEQSKTTSNAKVFRILHYNINLMNFDSESVITILEESDADLIFLHELTPEVWGRIMSAQRKWPYSRAVPRPDYYGVGVLSRLPLAELRFQELVNGNIPIAMVKIVNLNFPHVIISPHIIAPLGRDSHELQLKQFDEVAELLRGQPPSSIIVGDLNTTSHHPDFKNFLQKTALHDARIGRGILPSWPQPIAWLGIGIDHILVRGIFEVVKMELLDGGKSDHMALMSDIALKQ
jgi:endonuclease/exonuclease/phosphatase (EEP) superfamily protein YafD